MQTISLQDLDVEKSVLFKKYYPRVKQMLPKTEKTVFNYISKYRDKNTRILNSPYPNTFLIFNTLGEDANILYKATGINPDEMRATIRGLNLPEAIVKKENFNPLNTTFILMLRYYMETKEVEKFHAIMMYYAYDLYGKNFFKFFKPNGPKEGIMAYTINNLSGKFKLKQYETIEKLLEYSFETSMETWKGNFTGMTDDDIWKLSDAMVTRIRNVVYKIRVEYEKNVQNQNAILESAEFIEGTNVEVEQVTVSTEVESLATKYTNEFFSAKPSSTRVTMAAKLANVSVNELQVTIDLLFSEANIKEVKQFFSYLFHIYYSSIEFDDIRKVKVNTIKFQYTMDGIFRKGNSKDKNILLAKPLLDKWLTSGSQTYRKSDRPGTHKDYRRGVYMYFLLMITQSN